MRPIFGLGNLKTIEKELVNCYSSKIPNNQKSKLKYYQETAFNSHNQFLSFLLLGGWPACLLLILFFLFSLYRSNSILYTITLAMFLIFFIFENVLYRQLGTQLAGLLFGLLNTKLLTKDKKI
jgi:O-antigen ligase